MGLIHEVVSSEQIGEPEQHSFPNCPIVNSPVAMTRAKLLIQQCESKPLAHELIDYTSELIAKVRVSEQGQEGLSAFFEKRSASWVNEGQP